MRGPPSGLWLGTWAKFLLGWRLGPYVPTPPHVVASMLRLAELSPGDILYDLGCGDGRVCVAACSPELGGTRRDVRAVGFELDPRLAAEARRYVEDVNLGGAVEIREEDALGADLGDATVVALYLSETGNRKLMPSLAKLRAGARVVTFTFPLCDRMRPTKSKKVDGISLYMYRKGSTGANSWVGPQGEDYIVDLVRA